MRRTDETFHAVFHVEYPLPNHEHDTEWEEVSYEVEAIFDPGEPVSWDCPGSWPGVSDIVTVRQLADYPLPSGPDVSGHVDEKWPGYDAMWDALNDYAEDLCADVPSSHRYHY